MTRSVPEWIGRTDDSMPTDACKRRILDRQNWRCAITGVEFRDGVKAEFDHIRPLWLDGENREDNLQAITEAAHKAKTQTEATVRAKVNRNQIKRILGKKKSSLSNPKYKKLMDGTVVDRRTGEVVSR
ncbi:MULTISPECIES: HNH endonuclease [unclassified Rhizobium]|uniref:HNH endonuclease n=1 Tax=unclassified Rhizobium TaxID=2613769 RepID=UPI003811D3E1